MVERLNDGAENKNVAVFPEIDKRNPRKRKVTLRDVATLYGQGAISCSIDRKGYGEVTEERF